MNDQDSKVIYTETSHLETIVSQSADNNTTEVKNLIFESEKSLV